MRSAALRLVENDPPTILSVATAVPRFRLDQAEVARAAARVFDRERSDIERLMPVFDNAGIATRHSSVPMEWYFESHGWQERNQRYLANAVELLTNAATEALAAGGPQAQRHRRSGGRLHHRHRDPEPRCRAAQPPGPAADHPAAADLRARLRRRRDRAQPRRRARPHACPTATCCSSRSSCAPSPSGAATCPRATSSARPCSATAPPPW